MQKGAAAGVWHIGGSTFFGAPDRSDHLVAEVQWALGGIKREPERYTGALRGLLRLGVDKTVVSLYANYIKSF